MYRDLLLVTKIRNDFAHSVKITSFEDASIKSRVESLRALKVWQGVAKRTLAEMKENPKDPKKLAAAQIMQDELSTIRDTF